MDCLFNRIGRLSVRGQYSTRYCNAQSNPVEVCGKNRLRQNDGFRVVDGNGGKLHRPLKVALFAGGVRNYGSIRRFRRTPRQMTPCRHPCARQTRSCTRTATAQCICRDHRDHGISSRKATCRNAEPRRDLRSTPLNRRL